MKEPSSTLLPYTTLFRSPPSVPTNVRIVGSNGCPEFFVGWTQSTDDNDPQHLIDRKSTRLNSRHLVISYAVFCLIKKNRSPICIDINIIKWPLRVIINIL